MTIPKKILLPLTAIILLVIPLVAVFNLAYANRIYPGIRVAGLNLGKKNREQAFNILEGRVSYFENQSFKIFYKQRAWNIEKEDIALKFDLEKTLNQAFDLGHEKNIAKRILSQILLTLGQADLPMRYTLDPDKLDQYLHDNLSLLREEPVSAKLVLKDSRFYIIPEKEGKKVNFEKLKAEIKKNLDGLSENRIEVRLKTEAPELTRIGILPAYRAAQEASSKSLKLTWEGKYWTINPQTIISWIDFELSEDLTRSQKPAPLKKERGLSLKDFTLSRYPGGEEASKVLKLTLNRAKTSAFLESIAPELSQEPINALFKMAGGKVTLFKPGQDGKALDFEATIQQIESALVNNTPNLEKQTETVVKTIVPSVSNQNINDLGITTLIGTGESDFAGSPANRRHNIRIGAGRFNGVLIKPNQEFSVIETLGEVSAQTGYKPELVIKPEGTIPEFGGGLCQVSTTIFRSAIYSGLPILERKPHRYVVSYYKPIGMDATIYIPHPDVRFKNNTAGHILIQSRISGNKLYFDFYGTDDNRKIEIKGPVYTSGWIEPGEPAQIETNTLPAGQKKQIERAHKGVSTVFHRTVTRDGEEILKDSFYSKYYPWKAVFLVGAGTPPKEEEKEEPKPPPPPPKPEPTPEPPEEENEKEEE